MLKLKLHKPIVLLLIASFLFAACTPNTQTWSDWLFAEQEFVDAHPEYYTTLHDIFETNCQDGSTAAILTEDQLSMLDIDDLEAIDQVEATLCGASDSIQHATLVLLPISSAVALGEPTVVGEMTVGTIAIGGTVTHLLLITIQVGAPFAILFGDIVIDGVAYAIYGAPTDLSLFLAESAIDPLEIGHITEGDYADRRIKAASQFNNSHNNKDKDRCYQSNNEGDTRYAIQRVMNKPVKSGGKNWTTVVFIYNATSPTRSTFFMRKANVPSNFTEVPCGSAAEGIPNTILNAYDYFTELYQALLEGAFLP